MKRSIILTLETHQIWFKRTTMKNLRIAKNKSYSYVRHFMNRLHIYHKTIRFKTPWHNEKIKCSLKKDQERSYKYLQVQTKRYLWHFNIISANILYLKSSNQKQQELVLLTRLLLFPVGKTTFLSLLPPSFFGIFTSVIN